MVLEIKEEEFSEKIKEKCIVDFFATWCPPCKMLSPIIDEVSNEVSEVNFYKVNIDENLNLSEKYGISHVPTLVLFENGKEVNRVSGYIDKEELKKFINI